MLVPIIKVEVGCDWSHTLLMLRECRRVAVSRFFLFHRFGACYAVYEKPQLGHTTTNKQDIKH
jgi:hypothetical protein